MTSAADIPIHLPATCQICFPQVDDGGPSAEVVVYEIALADLDLAELDDEAGRPAFTAVITSTCVAWTSGGGAPDNDAELQALATQIATDYYRWRCGRAELALLGIRDWTPSGLEDVVEWEQTDQEIVTRVRRGPWWGRGSAGGADSSSNEAGGGTGYQSGTHGSAPRPVYTSITMVGGRVTYLSSRVTVGGSSTLQMGGPESILQEDNSVLLQQDGTTILLDTGVTVRPSTLTVQSATTILLQNGNNLTTEGGLNLTSEDGGSLTLTGGGDLNLKVAISVCGPTTWCPGDVSLTSSTTISPPDYGLARITPSGPGLTIYGLTAREGSKNGRIALRNAGPDSISLANLSASANRPIDRVKVPGPGDLVWAPDTTLDLWWDEGLAYWTVVGGTAPHPLSIGRTGSQTLTGGTAASETLTLASTASATKGGVMLGSGDWLNLPYITAPGTPGASTANLYFKSDGHLYAKNAAGTETDITAGASGGTVTSVSGTANQVSVATGTTTPVISLAGPHNFTTQTAHGVMLGQGTLAINTTAAATDAQILVGQTSLDPTWQTMSGDVTIGTSGVTAIGAGKVTYGKFQDTAGSSILIGRGAGFGLGAVQEISLGTGLAMSGVVLSTSGVAVTSGTLAQFAATTSAQLAGVISDETGSGALVFATSPTLTTPLLGTPTSGTLTNCTGTASGLTAGNVTTNANLTGPITSVGNATSIASQTGTGTTFVMNTSPTLVTPLLGTPTSGVLTNCTGLPIAGGGTGQTTAYGALDALMVQGADIASGSTTNLATATGQQVTVTGTTTITAFGTAAAGVLRSVRFSGILTLTHNATSLILPGGANITTASGDTMLVESLGSGNWRCWSYQRGASPPVSGTNTGDTGGTVTTLSIVTANGVSGSVANATTTPAVTLTLGDITPTSVAATGVGSFKLTDSATTTSSTVFTIDHASSGTPDVGFGLFSVYKLASSTTAGREAGYTKAEWVTATDASRKARVSHWVADTAEREYLRGEASGTAAMIGVLGAASSAQLVSPDAGTALVTFGFASGTPTFAGANITGTATIPAAAYPTFVAAGASAAKGAVPAPGATSHSTNPYPLTDAATFIVPSGKVLAYNSVATDQTTTSSTMGDLATVDSITFTLDVAADVLIVYQDISYNATLNGGTSSQLMFDGSLETGASTLYSQAPANSQISACMVYSKNLASGSHTVKMQHADVTNTTTAHFYNRRLVAFLRA